MQLQLFDLASMTNWYVAWSDPWDLCEIPGCSGVDEALGRGLCYEHERVWTEILLTGTSGVRIGELLKR